MREVLESLPEAERRLVMQGSELRLLPSSWYPDRLLHALADIIIARVPTRGRTALLREAARASIETPLSGIYRSMFRALKAPAIYSQYAQKLWNLYYDNGTYHVEAMEPRVHEISITDWVSHHPLVCASIVGSTEAIYEAMGCTDATAWRTACADTGGAECRFRVEWGRG